MATIDRFLASLFIVILLVFAFVSSGCADYKKLSVSVDASNADLTSSSVDLAGTDAVENGNDLAGTDAFIAAGDLASNSTDMAGELPASCVDVKNGNPGAVDGPFMLYIGHSASKPWGAYCRDMATTPKDYLQLAMTGINQNFSQYTTGGSASGTSARTNYTRVRIDPVTLFVDVTDQTYSTSMGMITQGPNITASMNYGRAQDCSNTNSGGANVDLTDTPFSVKTGAFALFGYIPQGSATYSSADQVVTLAGGGSCGGMGVSLTYPGNSGGFRLPLVYP